MTNAKTDDRHIVAVILGGRSGASRDQAMAELVRSNLPRAYAGLRQTPSSGDGGGGLFSLFSGGAARPTMVADAEAGIVPVQVPVPAPRPAVEAPPAPPAPPARKALDPSSLRPVVASAAGAGTATPSQPLRLQANGLTLPANAQAFAPTPIPDASRFVPAAPPPAPRVEERTQVARLEAPEAKREAPRAAASAWLIQLGAVEDEEEAEAMLSRAKSEGGRALAGASGFTEKVTKSGTTLYRARFSGFDESDEAEAACKALKRSGFKCFATRG
jgi:D-alanyl-D-alanine carboxypeptidase